MATQQFIDNLIVIIENAEDPESVTNEMVAAVFDHLNTGYKNLLTNNSAVATEKAERQAADAALQSTIETVQLALQKITASAGDSPFININYLCEDTCYTLSTAIKALIDLENESGVRYRKPGLVIVYRTSEDPDAWAAKMFVGNVAQMTPTAVSKWIDFGGTALDSSDGENVVGCECEAIPSNSVTDSVNDILNSNN